MGPQHDWPASDHALVLAAGRGDLPQVETLLRDGAVAVHHHAAVRACCAAGHLEVLRALEDRGSVAEGLRWACRAGHERVVGHLLQSPRVNPSGSLLDVLDGLALRGPQSARESESLCALLLRDPRVLPGIYESEALRRAARDGHAGILQLLLEDGRSSVHTRSNYALRAALARNRGTIVSLLLEEYCRLSEMQLATALESAVACDHDQVLQVLVISPGVGAAALAPWQAHWQALQARWRPKGGRAELGDQDHLLLAACKSDARNCARMLLDDRARPSLEALECARSPEVLRLLLVRGAPCGLWDAAGEEEARRTTRFLCRIVADDALLEVLLCDASAREVLRQRLAAQESARGAERRARVAACWSRLLRRAQLAAQRLRAFQITTGLQPAAAAGIACRSGLPWLQAVLAPINAADATPRTARLLSALNA